MIRLRINVIPQGKARPVVVGRHAFTPEKTRTYENRIKREAIAYMANNRLTMIPMGVPLKVNILALFPCPQSWSKRKKAEHEGAPHLTRPDADNVIKALLDAMNGIVYHDDSQVCEVTARKMYGLTPCVVIEISEIGETDA